MINDIRVIQECLKQNDLDAFIIFTNDDHGSEYVPDYFKFRAYVCGFTGSAGTLVITKEDALLWTDGRYFLQAATQLAKTNTKLMKMGEPGVPGVYEYIQSLAKEPKVSFDFRLATVSFVEKLKSVVNGIQLINNERLADELWANRPKLKKSIAWALTDDQAGQSIADKMKELRKEIKKSGASYALVSSLDDIAWLYNLRGDDITYNPVNYAYSLVSENKAVLYMDSEKVNSEVMGVLNANDIVLKPYDDVYKDIATIGETILIDKSKTNYALYSATQNKKETDKFPTTIAKAVKNEVEINNIKEAHLEDAVAMVKFMKYIKTNVGKKRITEISAADKLEAFRREGKNFLDLSFDTICGFGEHGAIVHYSATPETDAEIVPNNLLLVDSGAQYTTGTTDITRTYALGNVTDNMKKHYTLVLKAHIAVAQAVFPEGTSGYAIDMLAREPIYKELLDYRHGTGHGVGYILNVHEGPQRIALRAATWETLYPMKPGMVTSNEPGLYFEGEYGIRHENLVLCVNAGQSEYGNFYEFETLTYVPFDLDAIDATLLSNEEKQWLNQYHRDVFAKLSPYLDESLLDYLKNATRAIV